MSINRDGTLEKNTSSKSSKLSTSDWNIPDWAVVSTLVVLATLLFKDFVFSNDMLYGSDTLSLGYMAREFFADLLRNGVFPMWNPLLLGGTPFIDSLAGGDSLYPPSLLLLLILDTHRALGWKLIIHIILAGWFMYKWIQSLHLSKSSAFVAAVAYSMSPVMVTLVHGGQDGKIFVIALTPLVFWVTESFLNQPSARNFSLLSLVIGSIILTTHFQMAYFLFIGVSIYFVTKVFRSPKDKGRSGRTHFPRRMKLCLGYALAGIFGLSLAAVQFFPAASYVVDYSRRTSTTVEATAVENRSYSSSWSLHPEEIMGLAVPEFVGVSNGTEPWTQNTYWGRNGFKGNHEYLGIVVLLLAGLSLLGKRKKHLTVYMSCMGLVALFFALGEHTPLWRIFYELVPGISLFRAPSLAIFLTTFSVVTLMALGLEDIVISKNTGSDQLKWTRRRAFLSTIWVLLLGGFFLARSGVLSDLWVSLFYQDITEGSRDILRNNQDFITWGLLNSLIVTTALILSLVAYRKRYFSVQVTTLLVIFIIAMDMGRINKAFVTTVDFERFRAPEASIQTLLNRQTRETPFRVLSLVGLNGQDVRPGMFGLELAGGHHPNDIARYRDLIGMVGSGLPVNLLTNSNVMRILNVRYVLWPKQLGTPTDQGLPEEIVNNLTVLPEANPGDSYAESIYRFPTLERARLVSDFVVIPEESEALAFMLSDNFNPNTQVVLHEEFPMTMSGDSKDGSVIWVSRGINHMELEVTTKGSTFLVLSDNWFPGWRSQVNGTEVDILRVNHSLRGIPLQAGKHSVSIYYQSKILTWSLNITGAVLVLLIGLGLVNPLAFEKSLTTTEEVEL